MRTPTMASFAAFWLFCILYLSETNAFGRRITAFAPRGHQISLPPYIAEVRGGATPAVDDDEYDEDEEETEDDEEEIKMGGSDELDEEEEDEEEFDAVLAASAVKASAKTKAKIESRKTTTAKKAVSAKLLSKAPKKKKSSLLKKLHVPYIIRACLNPFTAFAMTKAFWASLFNLNYLEKETSQELRSALEEKARKGGTSGGKGRRKMKRGQAKTLSDLPQLST